MSRGNNCKRIDLQKLKQLEQQRPCLLANIILLSLSLAVTVLPFSKVCSGFVLPSSSSSSLLLSSNSASLAASATSTSSSSSSLSETLYETALSSDKVVTMDNLPENIQSLIQEAKSLFEASFFEEEDNSNNERANYNPIYYASTAPGRVNLIGEHTDYTGGYVLPLAIGYGTVVYGRGAVVKRSKSSSSSSSSFSSSLLNSRIVSNQHPAKIIEFEATTSSISPTVNNESGNKWVNYVQGVILQYLFDLNNGRTTVVLGEEEGEEGEEEVLVLDMAIAGDVPLGSGLSSSASLEVATAVFLESVLDHYDDDRAFSSSSSSSNGNATATTGKKAMGEKEKKIERALRCQRAENTFCGVPCGVMDQFVSSAGCRDKLLLIDCRSLDFREVSMMMISDSDDDSKPVLVVTNSNVKHDLGEGEYPIRVKQCKEATELLKSKVNSNISSLRDATVKDIEEATKTGALGGVLLQRARHVVSENQRTVDTAEALEKGDWELVGKLMNESHASMKDDYEVSCDEIDILVELAQKFDGVYGSRLTGGGFGGCTVTLVKADFSQKLMDYLKAEYEKRTGMKCDCFETSPADGARRVSL